MQSMSPTTCRSKPVDDYSCFYAHFRHVHGVWVSMLTPSAVRRTTLLEAGSHHPGERLWQVLGNEDEAPIVGIIRRILVSHSHSGPCCCRQIDHAHEELQPIAPYYPSLLHVIAPLAQLRSGAPRRKHGTNRCQSKHSRIPSIGEALRGGCLTF